MEDCSRKATLTEYVLNTPILSIVCLIGIIGNVLSLGVLLRTRIRTPFTILLWGLALFDALFLLIVLTYEPIRMYLLYWCYEGQHAPGVYQYLSVSERIHWYIEVVMKAASFYMTVVVNIDRYIWVNYPLKAMTSFLSTTRKAVTAILVVAVLSCIDLLGHLKAFLPTRTVTVYINATNCDKGLWMGDIYDEKRLGLETTFTSPECQNTTGRWESRTELIGVEQYETVMTWIFIIFVLLVPYLAVFFLNWGIVRGLRKAGSQRGHGLSEGSERERQSLSFTKALLKASGVFLLCIGTSIIFLLGVLFKIQIVVEWTSAVSSVFNALNSAANPIIYCFSAQHFRDELRVMLRFPAKENFKNAETVEMLSVEGIAVEERGSKKPKNDNSA